jgi:ABC-2 type transport system ATP-binding protein
MTSPIAWARPSQTLLGVDQQTFSTLGSIAGSPRLVRNARATDGDCSSSASAICLTGLTKRFSTRGSLADILRRRRRSTVTVVDRVSFDVDVGEVFGLLGPNGAGKTTLFKMLSTMLLADDGRASVCGHDVRRHPAAVKRALAAVSSDERSLNWRLSARENLLLFAALHRVPRESADQRVASVLRTVGLESTGRKLVAVFSSGMRQRLLIARALLARPRVLLLDEPTRALDPISAQELRAFMRAELVERQGCTIVLATHNTDEALGFCDRVGVLNRGRLLATGPASELAARFGEDRYRILTTDGQHHCFARLEELGVINDVARRSSEPSGWFLVECSIAGDPSQSAHVLRVLHESGACIARLERIEPSLADLIGRIIAATAPGESDA